MVNHHRGRTKSPILIGFGLPAGTGDHAKRKVTSGHECRGHDVSVHATGEAEQASLRGPLCALRYAFKPKFGMLYWAWRANRAASPGSHGARKTQENRHFFEAECTGVFGQGVLA
jgi:hypothetical protein